jgi:nucleoside-diphosphate-sugar epimerase
MGAYRRFTLIHELKGKCFLITGGTGFIGSRLVEILIKKYMIRVKAILNRFSTASKIARFDIEMIKADLTDSESISEVLKDCDYVIHCAHDWTNNSFNIKAGINLIKAAARSGIKRVVHTSTISVYRQPNSGLWTEKNPKGPRNDPYGSNKLAVEKAITETALNLGQDFAILQPSIVYGPWGSWTLGPLSQLSSHKVVLVNGGSGICNPVYVDDVAEAMILAAVHPKAEEEILLITGPDTVTWKEFWGMYESMLGIQSTVSFSIKEINSLRKAIRKSEIKKLVREVALSIGKTQTAYQVMKKMPPSLIALAKRILLEKENGFKTHHIADEKTKPLMLPEKSQIHLFVSTAKIDITKAKSLIGYNPRYSFSDGMAHVREWVKWANISGSSMGTN